MKRGLERDEVRSERTAGAASREQEGRSAAGRGVARRALLMDN